MTTYTKAYTHTHLLFFSFMLALFPPFSLQIIVNQSHPVFSPLAVSCLSRARQSPRGPSHTVALNDIWWHPLLKSLWGRIFVMPLWKMLFFSRQDVLKPNYIFTRSLSYSSSDMCHLPPTDCFCSNFFTAVYRCRKHSNEHRSQHLDKLSNVKVGKW